MSENRIRCEYTIDGDPEVKVAHMNIVLNENIHTTVQNHFAGKGPRVEISEIAIVCCEACTANAPGQDEHRGFGGCLEPLG